MMVVVAKTAISTRIAVYIPKYIINNETSGINLSKIYCVLLCVFLILTAKVIKLD